MFNIWDIANTDSRIFIKDKTGNIYTGFVVELMDAETDEEAPNDAIAIGDKGWVKILEDYEIEEIGFAD